MLITNVWYERTSGTKDPQAEGSTLESDIYSHIFTSNGGDWREEKQEEKEEEVVEDNKEEMILGPKKM